MSFAWQCGALETAGLKVLHPGTDAYETRDASYFSVSAQLSPNCIVQPICTDEVAAAITTLEKTGCNWAVRGGGHMTWAGASNSEWKHCFVPSACFEELMWVPMQSTKASPLTLA